MIITCLKNIFQPNFFQSIGDIYACIPSCKEKENGIGNEQNEHIYQKND